MQGQGARRAAAGAVGVDLQKLRQTAQGTVEADATDRPVVAEAHLRQQRTAAVAALEEQVGARPLGR